MAVYRAINSAIFTRSSISVGALQRLLQKCYLIIALDDAAPQSATLSRSYSRSSRETLPAHRDLVSDFDSSGPASGIKCLWQTKGGGDETLENFGNSDGRVVLQRNRACFKEEQARASAHSDHVLQLVQHRTSGAVHRFCWRTHGGRCLLLPQSSYL
jgi:hypothetical protein